MKENKKIHHARRIISLFIVLCMVISFAPTIAFADGDVSSVQIEVKNAQNGRTQYKVNDGNWIDLNESKQYDVAEINNNDRITVRAVPNEGQELDTFGTQFWVNGNQENIDHNVLQTEAGWSFTCNEGGNYQVCVEYRNGGNPNPGDNQNEETSQVQIEVKNAQNGLTKYKVNDGDWTDLVQNGTFNINDIKPNDQIWIRAVPNQDQELDTFGTQFWVNGNQENIDHNVLQNEAGWNFTCKEGNKYQVCVEYHNGEGNPAPSESGEFRFTCQSQMSGSIFYKLNETDGFLQVSKEDNRYNSISLGEATNVTIKLVPNSDYQLDAVRGVALWVNGDKKYHATGEDMVDFISEEGHTFDLSAIVGENTISTSIFDLEFGFEGDNPDNNDPEPEPDWYTISWSGGNVTVENGKVLAERIHVAQHDSEPAKTYTVIESEYAADENDTIYSLWDTIGASKDELGEDALLKFGLGFSQSDLFIAKDLGGVSIDFKFIPKYGYQLKNIYTNEEQTESFLNNFATDDDNISTFTFNVKVNQNTHFCVYFEAVSDTVDVTAESVTDASITNGENATDSGSLKMTVADINKDEVSEEFKKQVGQSAENALYLDMNLFQIVSKGGENGNWENQLTDLNDAITVTLRVPAPIDGNSYYIVREHGENADKTYSRIDVTFVPDKNDPTMGTVTFETDKFSSYALAQAQLMSAPINNSERIENPTIVTDSWTNALPTNVSSATALKLTVADNGTATDVVKNALASAAGVTPNADKSFYLDIDLTATVEDNDIPVTNLNQPVTVTITVPAISPQEEYTVVRQHIDSNGNVSYDKLDSTYNRTTNQLQFQTDKFSVYAVLVSAETNNPAGGTHTHTLTLVSAKDSTCTEAGNKAYYTCDGCDKWFEDAAGTIEITNHNSVVLPAKGHTVSDWTSYSIIEGVNSSWTKNTDGTLTFRANGDFSKFTGVKIDGTLIDTRNYTAASGSTVITLKADYLKTLSVGTHKLTVVYTDGECSTNFEVKKAASEQAKPAEGNKTNTTSPKTGDNSNLLLWMVLLFVSSFGILGTTVYGKKKRVK